MPCKRVRENLITGECIVFQSKVQTEIEGRRVNKKNRIDLLMWYPNIV